MAQTNFQVSTTLTGYAVAEKAALPIQTVKHMEPIMKEEKSMELEAVDRWGQQWALKYCSYTLQTGKKKNPVLTGDGWRKLVQDNGVQQNDELIFSGHQVAGADGVQYLIQVIRQIVPLYGEPVSVEVLKPKRTNMHGDGVIPSMTFQGQPM